VRTAADRPAGVGSRAVVRPMRWQDLAQVTALEERLYPDSAWSPAMWWGELAARPRRHYLVVDLDPDSPRPVVAGYAGLTLAGHTADVMTIGVDPAQRGLGRGGELLSALHEHARGRGAREMLLEVRADNRAALALYAAHGYRTVSVRRGYYQPAGVDAIVQRHELSGGPALTGD